MPSRAFGHGVAIPARPAEVDFTQQSVEARTVVATPNVGGEGTARMALQAGSPQPLSHFEVRALVAGLDPTMPLYRKRPLIERTKLPVSPGTGGRSRRTKVHIINDVRRTVGLPPLATEPPMGEPVEWEARASPIPLEWQTAPEMIGQENDDDVLTDDDTTSAKDRPPADSGEVEIPPTSENRCGR